MRKCVGCSTVVTGLGFGYIAMTGEEFPACAIHRDTAGILADRAYEQLQRKQPTVTNMYSIVAAKPFVMYTGTITYTHLFLFGLADTKEKAAELLSKAFDECGLAMAIDLSDGKPADL